MDDMRTINELSDISAPIIEWLRANTNGFHFVLIDCDGARLLRTDTYVPMEYIHDKVSEK